ALERVDEAEEILAKSGDAELKELAEAEKKENEEKLGELEHDIKKLLVPKDPYDEKNIYLEIRAG
ncbi:MAG TPA: peptide chain release factor 1, partial [Flexistipes sinusarabici]|nr:peptide chain release factor 1 [Flexistipes sinusarabici]